MAVKSFKVLYKDDMDRLKGLPIVDILIHNRFELSFKSASMDLKAVKIWINENCKKLVFVEVYEPSEQSYLIAFEDNDDAVLFKLSFS
jgi:hypothetical protein